MADRRLTEFSHGAGCGCKLSPVDLAEVIGSMAGHPATISPDLVVGFGTADDHRAFNHDLYRGDHHHGFGADLHHRCARPAQLWARGGCDRDRGRTLDLPAHARPR